MKKRIPLSYTLYQKQILDLFQSISMLPTLFLYHYLTKVMPKTKRLIIYMDNCISTNKNNFAFNLLYYLVHTQNLFDEI